MFGRLVRYLTRGSLILLLLFVAGELVARYGVGLGDPPLSMSHPDIEYMFRPSQDCMRFGNRVRYNAFSMRSDEFSFHKSDPNEFRVMVLGDSVINGGNLTDQSELATERLKRELSERLGRPVVVGNISAGSWGPPNLAAYVEVYGLFDADVVVLVVSSHDAHDMPTFDPLVGVNPSFPDTKPTSALVEGMVRYLPRYLPSLGDDAEPSSESGNSQVESDAFPARPAVQQIIGKAREAGAMLLLALHPSRKELTEGPEPGHGMFQRVAAEHDVEFIDLADAFRTAREQGGKPYRDSIHPNPAGQRILAEQLLPHIVAAAENGASAGP